MSPTDIHDLWERLERWGSRHAPAMLEDLNPGASEEEVVALESALGRRLPAEFRTSLLIHNGESDGWPCRAFADRGAYLSTLRILDTWERLQEVVATSDPGDQPNPETLIEEGVISVEGAVKPVLFTREWVPIMDCNGDVFWAVDFAPAPGGVEGQVIEVGWECGTWKVIAPSFGSLLSDYVSDLERGGFQVIDGLPTREPT